MTKLLKDISQTAFWFSTSILLLFGAFIYGAYAHKADVAPIPQLRDLYNMVWEVFSPDRILKTSDVVDAQPIQTLLEQQLQPGLILVVGNAENDGRTSAVRIIDRSGRVITEWQPEWGSIWSDDEGDFESRPKQGMFLHGIDILADGSFVANFEHLSTFRMDPCGNVLWKLDNLGHHAVHLSDDDSIWVTAEDRPGAATEGPANFERVRHWTLQNIDLDGTILRTISIVDIFLKNGLEGLLFMSSLDNLSTVVTGDTLHLNDVDTFPSGMQSEIFEAGDLLISLRNINTVLVFDKETLEVKFITTGSFTRQHDPDFLANDRISIFDNRNFILHDGSGAQSRIIEIDVHSGAVRTILGGDSQRPFSTQIMGVHQRLENGNILVVASGEGRVLEYLANGQLAWRYDNRTGQLENSRIYNAMVLPPEMDEEFFMTQLNLCSGLHK